MKIIYFLIIMALGNFAWAESEFFSKKPEFSMIMPKGGFQYNPLKYYTSLEAQIYTGLYEALLIYDPVTQKPIPATAEKYEVSSDLLTYTFTINPNARFSNNDKITAEDFVASWLLLLKLDDKAPFSSLLDLIKGAKSYRTKLEKDSSKVGLSVNAKKQLVVVLERPASQFIQIVCHQSLVPIHEKNRSPDFDWTKPANIIYSGAFTYDAKNSKADFLALLKNPNYWDSKNVELEKINITFTDDDKLATQMYNEKLVQWLTGGFDYEALQNKSAFIFNPQFSTNFLFFNFRVKAYQNASVRKAVTLLLDLPGIRSKDAYFLPTTKLIPEIPFYPKIKSIEQQNQDEALRLLDEAGFPKGKGLPKLVLKLPEGANSKRLAEFFQTALNNTVIPFEFVESDYDAYNEFLNNADYVIGDMGWIGDYGDPMTFLDLFVSKGSLNTSSYSDQDYDTLIEDASKLSGTERYKKLAKAEEKLLLDAVIIPLSNSPALNIIDKDEVDGWYENPFDLHPFKFIKPKVQKPPRNITMAN